MFCNCACCAERRLINSGMFCYVALPSLQQGTEGTLVKGEPKAHLFVATALAVVMVGQQTE